jgi:hypothetical protein
MVAVSGYLDYRNRQAEIKKDMLAEHELINETVEWLGKQIDQKLLEIEAAIDHYNESDVEKLRGQVTHLLLKLRQEDSHITGCLFKYKEIVKDEEKALLSGFSQEKSLSLWGVPSHTHWQTQGTGISSYVAT